MILFYSFLSFLEYLKSTNFEIDECILIMVGENVGFDSDEVIQEANNKSLKIMGGIFPGVIKGTEYSRDTILIRKIPASSTPLILPLQQVSSTEFTFPEVQGLTIVTFIDGLSIYSGDYLYALYDHYAHTVDYFGAGAGTMQPGQSPCVFTNEGIYQDAAAIVFLENNAILSVKHGWERIGEPMVATNTEKNIIYELNWSNALDVYKQFIKEDSGKIISKENFIEISKGYPFGLYVEGEEDLIRDPISVGDNGEINCIGDVPSNSVVYIMKGDEDGLIKSAKLAAEDYVRDSKKNKSSYSPFLVDCITRCLYMGDKYHLELQTIIDNIDENKIETELTGILTLGEISSNKKGQLMWYNKTLVLGAF
jgi:hypothetical protein